MSYVKRLVCLANSWKGASVGRGTCVAGRELRADNGMGNWIRPVGDCKTGAISVAERTCSDGREVQVLDIVEIGLTEPRPHAYQRENHLLDAARKWERAGRVAWGQLAAAAEEVQGPLWLNESSSTHGLNDRVPEAGLGDLTRSLYLVGPLPVAIDVRIEHNRCKVRAEFELASCRYRLVVTDPVTCENHKKTGTFPIDHAMLCISPGEAFQGHAYKLVAAVITPERAA